MPTPVLYVPGRAVLASHGLGIVRRPDECVADHLGEQVAAGQHIRVDDGQGLGVGIVRVSDVQHDCVGQNVRAGLAHADHHL